MMHDDEHNRVMTLFGAWHREHVPLWRSEAFIGGLVKGWLYGCAVGFFVAAVTFGSIALSSDDDKWPLLAGCCVGACAFSIITIRQRVLP